MTLKSKKISVLVNFSLFQAATHISRVNCADITGDRPRQSACEIKLMLSRVSNPVGLELVQFGCKIIVHGILR